MNQTQIALIIAVLAIFLAGFSLWKMLSFARLKKIFLTGPSGKDLEYILLRLDSQLKSAEGQNLILQENLSRLENSFNFAVQKVGLVRFNPFSDGGGNFSFSLALLDGANNGIVLTSMHGREQNRIYSKNIIEGKSEIILTEEEVEAVKLADGNYKNLNQKTKTVKLSNHK